MFAATTSPSYSPTWVSGQMPLTSPIAQSRSPARRYSSTWMPRGWPRRRPSPGRCPRRGGVDRWPPAAGRPGPRAVVELQDKVVAVPPRAGRVHPEHQLDAVPAQGLTERVAERRGLAGNDRSAPPISTDLAAEPADHLGELDAGGSGTQHQQAARDSLHAGRLPGAPDPVQLSQSGNGGHDRGRAGRHHDVRGGVPNAVDLDRAGPASRPFPRSRSMPCSASQRCCPASE